MTIILGTVETQFWFVTWAVARNVRFVSTVFDFHTSMLVRWKSLVQRLHFYYEMSNLSASLFIMTSSWCPLFRTILKYQRAIQLSRRTCCRKLCDGFLQDCGDLRQTGQIICIPGRHGKSTVTAFDLSARESHSCIEHNDCLLDSCALYAHR